MTSESVQLRAVLLVYVQSDGGIRGRPLHLRLCIVLGLDDHRRHIVTGEPTHGIFVVKQSDNADSYSHVETNDRHGFVCAPGELHMLAST
jgi:hypothetical protein